MKYFEMGIFVIPGVCLIRKYGSQSTAIFLYFSASRRTVTYTFPHASGALLFNVRFLEKRAVAKAR